MNSCDERIEKGLNEQIQIYQRLLEWAVECGFGYDNIPEYEQYKNEIEGMSYTDGLLYLASRSLKQEC